MPGSGCEAQASCPNPQSELGYSQCSYIDNGGGYTVCRNCYPNTPNCYDWGAQVDCTICPDDQDGDGYMIEPWNWDCQPLLGDDCAPLDPDTYPGATEVCDDGVDNHCPGDTGYGQVDCADPACSAEPDCQCFEATPCTSYYPQIVAYTEALNERLNAADLTPFSAPYIPNPNNIYLHVRDLRSKLNEIVDDGEFVGRGKF